MPCHTARARMLLRQGRATVYRRYPFTIVLKDRSSGDCQPIELKEDPGSKKSGLTLVAEFKKGKAAIWGMELEHRGQDVKKALDSRKTLRRSRRNRKTRYRAPRSSNRRRPEGWLPPSLMSRVYNIDTWTMRLLKLVPITSIAVETIRFDTQKLVNPEISGVEYQQGELFGYEIREYLLEKWSRKCVYCGKIDAPLEVEHIVPKSRDGTNRVSNLTLSCKECNRQKGNLTAEEYGHPDIQKQALMPLRDAAAVNATRYAIGAILKNHGLPITFWSGGRTKYNRVKQGYPKSHWIDAACVGESGEAIILDPKTHILNVKATGHGKRQMCGTDKYGFPIRHRTNKAVHFGFQTGDIVRAVVPGGKLAGVHVGRIAVRRTGNFQLTGIGDVSRKYCAIIHRKDGYAYA